MKNILTFSMLILFLGGCKQEDKEKLKVMPYPNMVSLYRGSFSFDGGVNIIYSDVALKSPVAIFKNKLAEIGDFIDPTSKNTILIVLEPSQDAIEEAYKLVIESDKIVLSASHPSGIFYGLMTIWQSIKFSQTNSIPCGLISDKPRFEYRGFMLDESRNFFGKDKVLEIIELMSLFKLNTFHWHLTDSPGWRIEIKAYPNLTTIGAKGNHSDSDAPALFYTKEDIKEIVAYAADRFVTIIPEIDMPGHADAANRAYPVFSVGGNGKTANFTFNPGKEGTYGYLSTILKEVSSLFPSEYIHLGGDEVNMGNQGWNKNEDVKRLMQEAGLKTPKDVEFYFLERMADSVSAMGKKVAGWDEMAESNISKEKLLIYWWRHDKPELLDNALSRKYSVVLCPRIPLYFDFVQHDSHENGRRWDGFGTVNDVYSYPDATHTFTKEETNLINGIQGNLWTERFDSEKWVDFMMFPRILALSESAWTEIENKDFERFQSVLPSIQDYLDDRNIYYFNTLNDNLTPEPDFIKD